MPGGNCFRGAGAFHGGIALNAFEASDDVSDVTASVASIGCHSGGVKNSRTLKFLYGTFSDTLSAYLQNRIQLQADSGPAQGGFTAKVSVWR